MTDDENAEKLNRRGFIGSAAAIAVSVAMAAHLRPANAHASKLQQSKIQLPSPHGGAKPEVAMLLYPGVTLLDLVGPQTVFAPSCSVHVVWKNTDLLETDSGLVM